MDSRERNILVTLTGQEEENTLEEVKFYDL
jgi:hypothetical protein